MKRQLLMIGLFLLVLTGLLAGCNLNDNPEDVNVRGDNTINPVSFGPGGADGRSEHNQARPGEANPEQANRQNKPTLPFGVDRNGEGPNGNLTTRNGYKEGADLGTVDEISREVIELTNLERQANGLSPLQLDIKLNEVAQLKSEDMAENNYFSHTSPTYGDPFDMLREFGVEYQTAAENIAAGQKTPEAVVKGWMNSEGHRKNILNKDITHIGVGYAEDEKRGISWTQMFIKK